MELIVTDRASIEAGIVVHGRYVVISIHDPDKPPAKIRCGAGLVDVLHVGFHDAEPTDDLSLPANIQLMTTDQARQIWDFVQRHLEVVDGIVCHCEQGMSRSPAVAAALAGLLGEDNTRIHAGHQPNEYVYGLMSQAGEG